MTHPFPQQFVVLDGGLERSLDAWHPPHLGGDAALLTPRGPIDGRLLLYDRSLEFRPSVGADRTRVVIDLAEIAAMQRELTILARRRPLGYALRITVRENRELRLLVERPTAWVDAIQRAAASAGNDTHARPELSAVPSPA